MTGPRSQIIAVNDFAWQKFQPGISFPRISFKVVWQDPPTKRRAQMTRFAPGAQLPLHRHVGDELIFVIEGAVSDESGTVTAGNVGYRPNGCVHTVTSTNGATVLAVLTGDIEPVAARERAPASAIVTLSDLPWIDARPGVRQKRIWEDKATERRALLARFEPGAALPLHRHVGDELIFLVEGANADESGIVATGNMNYRPNGCVHAVTTQHGATVLAVVWGHTEPV
jgi:anti-sigma factor ChrR (cupin superfamily)